MPLPIETPAPKASSLIKRFQQTIDASDDPPLLPLPKQRLSVDPDDPACRRRSWAVGSGGAGLPQTEVIWKGRQPSLSSGNANSNSSSSQLHPSLPVQDHGAFKHAQLPSSPLIKPHPDCSPSANAPPRLFAIPPTPIAKSSSVSTTLIFPSGTPIESLAPQPIKQSPQPTTDKAKVYKSTVSSMPMDRPKASVSADVPTGRTRKVTNVTAPTAASLAKIRSQDTHSIPLGPKVKPDSIIASGGLSRANSAGKEIPRADSATGRLLAATSLSRNLATPPANGSNATHPRLPSSPSRLSNGRTRAASTMPARAQTQPNSPVTVTTNPRASSTKAKTSPSIPPFGAGPGLRAQAKTPTPKKARSYYAPPNAIPAVPKATATPSARPATRARVASVATPIATRKSSAPLGASETQVNGPKTLSVKKNWSSSRPTEQANAAALTKTPPSRSESSLGLTTPKKVSKTPIQHLPVSASRNQSSVTSVNDAPISVLEPAVLGAKGVVEKAGQDQSCEDGVDKADVYRRSGDVMDADNVLVEAFRSAHIDSKRDDAVVGNPQQLAESLESANVDPQSEMPTTQAVPLWFPRQDDQKDEAALEALPLRGTQDILTLEACMAAEQTDGLDSASSDQIHIATSSTGSTVESLAPPTAESKKASGKRRSGIAAW